MVDTGTSDTAAAVGGGGATEANTSVEGSSTSRPVTSGSENSAILGAPAAEITAENQTDISTSMPSSLLPVALVGSILDFMPYKNLRASLLAGKFMAVGVAKEVKTLNIMRSSELVIPAARRFTNVTEVNCLCLMKPYPPEEYSRRRGFCEELSVDTALRIVPFLSAFPELKSAFLGGYFWRAPHGESRRKFVRYEYYMDHCTDLQVVFRALVEQFCTSFQSGDLPGDLDLRGILPIGKGAKDEGWTFASGKLICSARTLRRPSASCAGRSAPSFLSAALFEYSKTRRILSGCASLPLNASAC